MFSRARRFAKRSASHAALFLTFDFRSSVSPSKAVAGKSLVIKSNMSGFISESSAFLISSSMAIQELRASIFTISKFAIASLSSSDSSLKVADDLCIRLL